MSPSISRITLRLEVLKSLEVRATVCAPRLSSARRRGHFSCCCLFSLGLLALLALLFDAMAQQLGSSVVRGIPPQRLVQLQVDGCSLLERQPFFTACVQTNCRLTPTTGFGGRLAECVRRMHGSSAHQTTAENLGDWTEDAAGRVAHEACSVAHTMCARISKHCAQISEAHGRAAAAAATAAAAALGFPLGKVESASDTGLAGSIGGFGASAARGLLRQGGKQLSARLLRELRFTETNLSSEGGYGQLSGWVPACWPPLIRGAHPLFDGHAATSAHRCVGQETMREASLVIASVNDGWCECADGSDEPGTDACAGRGGAFWCPAQTTPTLGSFIPTSLVDDAICDCCDCSDESDESVRAAAFGAAIEPSCAAGGGALRAAAGAADAAPQPSASTLAAGVRWQDANWAESWQRWGEMRLHWIAMRQELELAHLRAEEGTLRGADRQRIAQRSREYTGIAHLLTAGFVDPIQVRALPEGAVPLALERVGDTPGSSEVAGAGEHAWPAGPYLPLLGACYNATRCTGICSAEGGEEYVWTLCPFQYASQAPSNGPEQQTLLGRWAGWGVAQLPTMLSTHADPSTPRAIQEYTEGEPCWEGPARTTRVELVCGASHELQSVEEDGKCSYLFLFATPAACPMSRSLEPTAEWRLSQARNAPSKAEASAHAEVARQQAGRAAQKKPAKGGTVRRKTKKLPKTPPREERS